MKLPEWIDCEEAAKAGTATALQKFIYENEPAGREQEGKFRKGLRLLIEEVMASSNAGGKQ